VKRDDETVTIGAAVPLGRVVESETFPLLGRVCGGIADRTVRNTLTLGGNICGKLPYREAVMPLLLSDATAVVASPETGSIREQSFSEVFAKRMLIEPGELLVQVQVPAEGIDRPGWNVRREKQGRIDYPLVHVVVAEDGGFLRFGFSGFAGFPFVSADMDDVLNQNTLPVEERAEQALQAMPYAIQDDLRGSGEYRRAVARGILVQILSRVQGKA
jgi:CO/xanthine dehydrogenase FAD-binding subunit